MTQFSDSFQFFLDGKPIDKKDLDITTVDTFYKVDGLNVFFTSSAAKNNKK